MLVTKDWIARNYNKFNKLYFGGTLPENIEFKISRSKKTWGYAAYRFDFVNDTVIPLSITLSNYYDSPEEVKIQTLLHEMIHIEDYMWHPEHFICEGCKIRANKYDAHGEWFQKEARRISKESGYIISTKVMKSEVNSSKLSVRSSALEVNKLNKARIVTVRNNSGYYWLLKTDVDKLSNIKRLVKRILGKNYNWVKVYTIQDQNIANLRSNASNLRGWRMDKLTLIKNLEKWGATQIESYSL